MQCPACLQTPPDEARFCPACGGSLLWGDSTATDPMEGKVLGGRYRVTKLIAEGGMGRVYLADQQMGTTVRQVAVKVMLAEYAHNAQVVERFLRECGTVCELEHRNTIKFFDYGQNDEGDLYIAMEFAAGESLAALVKRTGPLSPERVDRILAQICGSLQEAHDKGIIHRDVKPENILITSPGGEEDVVKVLDFGIARRDGGRDPRLTPLGLVLGSPPYMSPEQFAGQDVGPRSDIYSLAVVTFKALTGVLPFKAQEMLAWAALHMTAAPLPFETTEAGQAVPQRMKAAIYRALSKSPHDRPQSMRDFYQEVTLGLTRSSLVSFRAPLYLRSEPPPEPIAEPPPPVEEAAFEEPVEDATEVDPPREMFEEAAPFGRASSREPAESAREPVPSGARDPLAEATVDASPFMLPAVEVAPAVDATAPRGGSEPIVGPPIRRPTVVDQPAPAPPTQKLQGPFEPGVSARIKGSKPTMVEREGPPPTIREPVPPTMREPARRRIWPLIVSVVLVGLVIAGAVLLIRHYTGGAAGKSLFGRASEGPEWGRSPSSSASVRAKGYERSLDERFEHAARADAWRHASIG
jgi:serine/threonine protein kinase